MPFQDFREFLDALRRYGELFDVDRPVVLELEVAKALIALEATEDTVFERVLSGLAGRIPPVMVKDAPVPENVVTADAIDLRGRRIRRGAAPTWRYAPAATVSKGRAFPTRSWLCKPIARFDSSIRAT